MKTQKYKTISANKSTVSKEWFVVDAKDQILGRLASKVAYILRGKHKPDFTPHVDCGDNVIVINADQFVLTGKKGTDREYVSYSGYPGGKKTTTINEIVSKHPGRALEHAVKGMLPKNRLGRELFRNLYVYSGSEHKQQAQNPKILDLNTIK